MTWNREVKIGKKIWQSSLLWYCLYFVLSFMFFFIHPLEIMNKIDVSILQIFNLREISCAFSVLLLSFILAWIQETISSILSMGFDMNWKEYRVMNHTSVWIITIKLRVMPLLRWITIYFIRFKPKRSGSCAIQTNIKLWNVFHVRRQVYAVIFIQFWRQ